MPNSYTGDLYLALDVAGHGAVVARGYRYYLTHKNSNEFVDIEVGMVTDGVTVPAWLRPFVRQWQYLKAVLVHDKFCKTLRVELVEADAVTGKMWRHIGRAEIDKEFKIALGVLGCPKLKVQIFYIGVRVWFYFRGGK